LSGSLSNVSKDFVGIESRGEEMMTLLSKGLDDVRFLGTYEMGGIGKTTLSKAIYEIVHYKKWLKKLAFLSHFLLESS
jgi:hypothetical protein